MLKKAKRKFNFGRIISIAVIIAGIIITFSEYTKTRAQKEAHNIEAEKLMADISDLKQQNDEYLRLISNSDQEGYMLSAAIERGYAFPGETRYYAKSSD